MFGFDKHDAQSFAVSSIGALAVSAVCVFGAVAPVRAATPATAAAWQARVERQIDAAAVAGPTDAPLRKAVVVARFTADGDFAGVVLAETSGDRGLDREAVRAARALSYPALPTAMRGQPRSVRLNLFYGSADAVSEAVQADRRRPVVQLASR